MIQIIHSNAYTLPICQTHCIRVEISWLCYKRGREQIQPAVKAELELESSGL